MKEIQLTQGKVALVEDEDFERINKFKWYASFNKAAGCYYAKRDYTKDGVPKKMYMHRLVMNAQQGEIVDHKYHNTLDNRRSQLRICNASQSVANRPPLNGGTSKYTGVHFAKVAKRWRAQITFNKKHMYIGSFKNEEEAARAYNEKAFEFHGEFAYLNII